MENRKMAGLEEMATLFAEPVKTCMQNKYWEKWFKFLKVKMDVIKHLRGNK